MKYSCDKQAKACDETAVQDTAKGLQVARASRLNRFDNDSRFNANDRNVDNSNNFVRGIAQKDAETLIMTKPRCLWQELCSYGNLFLAYKKARKHKTLRHYVIEFEEDLKENLLLLQSELLLHCYKPKPLVNFIVRDPKTRKISKSDFRDRVVHHALCNIIEPIFEKTFIYDSYANRKDKGTLKALQRFDYFKRKVSRNNTLKRYILKADIKKYFENIDHKILMGAIKKRIKDQRILWLIKQILANHILPKEGKKGMPLGNLTSQFFANVYLNELDYFVKHKLKVNYYIRYVDDFVILGNNKWNLEACKSEINNFLKASLKIELHPDKSKISLVMQGTTFLGFKIFYYHKLLKKSNIRKFRINLSQLCAKYYSKLVSYDAIYDFIEGWLSYSRWASTFIMRKNILSIFRGQFTNEISTKEYNIQIRKYCPA